MVLRLGSIKFGSRKTKKDQQTLAPISQPRPTPQDFGKPGDPTVQTLDPRLTGDSNQPPASPSDLRFPSSPIGGGTSAPQPTNVEGSDNLFIRRREKLKSQGLSPQEANAQAALEQDPNAPVGGATGGRQVPVAEARANRAAAEAQLFTPAQELQGELSRDILNPPDIGPSSVGDIATGVAGVGLAVPAFIGNSIGNIIEKVTGIGFTEQNVDELAETPMGKLLGIGIVGSAGALAAIAGNAVLGGFVAKTGIAKGVGTTVGKASGFVKFGAAALGAQQAFDFRGQEMNTMRGIMRKMVEDGERIEAATRNGFPTTDSLELLRTMSNEVDEAEQTIKRLGQTNLQYRVADEFRLDSKLARSAREELARRVQAVENIARTGTAALNPEELLFQASQF